MDVDEAAPFQTAHNGVSYRFCSSGCLKQFLGQPGKFAERGSKADSTAHRADTVRTSSAKSYLPLVAILLLTMLAATARQASLPAGWNGMVWMHDFMGVFLVVFSMFKFFDLRGFADGFQMYDLLAKSVRAYAFAFPFLELALGLGYLAHWRPILVYAVTIGVMLFGAIGVFRALTGGRNLACACLGTVINVPLSTVALVEDVGMAAMAAAMLIGTL